MKNLRFHSVSIGCFSTISTFLRIIHEKPYSSWACRDIALDIAATNSDLLKRFIKVIHGGERTSAAHESIAIGDEYPAF